MTLDGKKGSPFTGLQGSEERMGTGKEKLVRLGRLSEFCLMTPVSIDIVGGS